MTTTTSTTTSTHPTIARRGRRRVLGALATLSAAVLALLLPVATASARIEPGPQPSRVVYQMPATPLPAESVESTVWNTVLVSALAVALVVAVAIAVWAILRLRHASHPATLHA
jgi:ABC-type Fe3+ transport system permease subunit